MIISGEFVWIWYWSTYISVLKALNLTEVSTIHTCSKQYVFNKIRLTHFHVCIQKCGKQSPRCPYQSRKPWKFMPNKLSIFQFFLAFDFFQFCMVICFFITATTANDLRLWRFSIPDFIHYFVLSLFFRRSQYFPFQC